MALGVQVTFDCADPTALADFWAEALGYIVQPPPEGFATWEDFLRANNVPEEEWDRASAVVDPDGVGPRLYFQKVPERKTAKNRVHLDVNAARRGTPAEERRGMVDALVARLQTLGAAVIRPSEEKSYEYWVVMQDPEGNEFCLQ